MTFVIRESVTGILDQPLSLEGQEHPKMKEIGQDRMVNFKDIGR